MPTLCSCGCGRQYLQTFWVLVDLSTDLPASICSGFYAGDKPMEAPKDHQWVQVRETLDQSGGAIYLDEKETR